jgi:hypothetical protein
MDHNASHRTPEHISISMVDIDTSPNYLPKRVIIGVQRAAINRQKSRRRKGRSHCLVERHCAIGPSGPASSALVAAALSPK